MILLWLDDLRDPTEWIPSRYNGYEIVWAKNYDEFVNWINENGLPDAVSFDHDLGEEGEYERSGYTAAKFLVEYCIDNDTPLPLYDCHSANPVGHDNIIGLLSNFEKSYL